MLRLFVCEGLHQRNTPHTARMAYNQTLGKVMQHALKRRHPVFRHFVENDSFRCFLGDVVYALTGQP
jgi:type I restriction enzyme, R subunit